MKNITFALTLLMTSQFALADCWMDIEKKQTEAVAHVKSLEASIPAVPSPATKEEMDKYLVKKSAIRKQMDTYWDNYQKESQKLVDECKAANPAPVKSKK